MELTWLNLVAYILIPILTAGIGGWVGAFLGDKYRKDNRGVHDSGLMVQGF